MGNQPFVLTLSCPDRPGIVHAVSSQLAAQGCNILDAQQYGDPETTRFFSCVSCSIHAMRRRRWTTAC